MKIREITMKVSDGALDQTLTKLYGRQSKELERYRSRIVQLVQGFRQNFAADAETELMVFSAPGRTELGGNHTDHQGGLVLTASVDLDMLAAVVQNESGVIRLLSPEFGMTRNETSDPDLIEEEKGTTAALIRGMICGCRKRAEEAGYPYTAKGPAGFDAYVLSDVPGGSGLSSSACFEILLGTVISGLFYENAFSPLEIAKIGQYAENVYFGKPSGLLDQMGCGIGGILGIDFASEEEPDLRQLQFDFESAGYALMVIDTGGDHSRLTPFYAAVPEEMRAVAREFGETKLSRVEESRFLKAIPKLREKTGDRAVMRALHYYAECRRVREQIRALENKDMERFLQLVKESGASSFQYLQNVDTYEDPARQNVAFALAFAERILEGKGAVRVHGGGFAGTIQAYVPLLEAEAFQEEMDRVLGFGSCRKIHIRPCGGVRLI